MAVSHPPVMMMVHIQTRSGRSHRRVRRTRRVSKLILPACTTTATSTTSSSTSSASTRRMSQTHDRRRSHRRLAATTAANLQSAHINSRREHVPAPVDLLLSLPLKLQREEVLSDQIGRGDVVRGLILRISDRGVGAAFLYQALDCKLGIIVWTDCRRRGGGRRRSGVVEGGVATVIEQIGRRAVIDDEGPHHGRTRRRCRSVDGLCSSPWIEDRMRR